MVCWAQTVPVTARIGPKSEFRLPQKSGRVVSLPPSELSTDLVEPSAAVKPHFLRQTHRAAA